MDFTMVIPASEFKDFQLKVVSLAPIKVTVIGHDDEVLENSKQVLTIQCTVLKQKMKRLKK